MTRVPGERDEELRAAFWMDIGTNYRAEQLMFVDESGANRHATNRRYAWARRNQRARRRELIVRGLKYV